MSDDLVEFDVVREEGAFSNFETGKITRAGDPGYDEMKADHDAKIQQRTDEIDTLMERIGHALLNSPEVSCDDLRRLYAIVYAGQIR